MKTLNDTTVKQAKEQISDLETWGYDNMWKLLSKASSKSEGSMKSTKALEIAGVGCLVQVTTQQRNPDNTYALADAVAFVPGVKISTTVEDGKVVKRELVKYKSFKNA